MVGKNRNGNERYYHKNGNDKVLNEIVDIILKRKIENDKVLNKNENNILL